MALYDPQCYHPTNRVGLGPTQSTTGILAITARIPWYSKSALRFSTTDRPTAVTTSKRPGHARAQPGQCLVQEQSDIKPELDPITVQKNIEGVELTP